MSTIMTSTPRRIRLRTTGFMAGVVATTFALAACTVQATTAPPTPEPSPVVTEVPVVTPNAVVTPEAAPVVATAPPVSNKDQYVSLMRDQYNFAGVQDTVLIDTGNAICEALDSGAGVGFVYATLLSTEDVDVDMVNTTFASAIVFLCPEYSGDLDAFIESAS